MEKQDTLPRRVIRIFIAVQVLLCLILLAGYLYMIRMPGESYTGMIRMPGESYTGALPPLTEREKSVSEQLRRDIEMLTVTIGERHVAKPQNLVRSASYFVEAFQEAGLPVRRQPFISYNIECENIEGEKLGAERPDEIIVVGAHYDCIPGTVGANDNGTGVAGTLALARSLAAQQTARTIRFVLFANEEPPFFQTEEMGSLVYARSCRDNQENIVGMISLETMGYYSEVEGSQQYPALLSAFYPTQGNFIAFVGDTSSQSWVKNIVRIFREECQFPSEGAALPATMPGVGWSDHWSFWQANYPAIEITDTAPFRYPHYHKATDTVDKIQYEHLARVIVGLERVLLRLANES